MGNGVLDENTLPENRDDSVGLDGDDLGRLESVSPEEPDFDDKSHRAHRQRARGQEALVQPMRAPPVNDLVIIAIPFH